MTLLLAVAAVSHEDEHIVQSGLSRTRLFVSLAIAAIETHGMPLASACVPQV